MKKQINGKSYNTESANKLARIDSGHSPSDFEYWEETLYRTKTGNFFLYGWGRGNSRYGDGDKIIPMEQEEVMEWVEHNLPSIDGEFIQWFSEHKNHRIEEKQKNCKGSKGIRKGNAPGTYQAVISVNSVSYYLGQYDNIEAATQIRLQAEQAKENGEFIQWFSEHKKHQIEEKHKKQRGVHKGNAPGTYQAAIRVDNVPYYLGRYDNIEAAMQIRLQAEQAKENGEFIQWFSEHKKHRIEEKQKKQRGVYKGYFPGTYRAVIIVDNVPYYLGQYDNIEAATQIRLQAEQAKENGEFIQWFSEHKKHRIEEKHKIQRGVYKGTAPGTYQANINVDNVPYYLGQYDSREAAMQIRLQAEQAKENGEFIQWFSEHKKHRIEEKHKKQRGVYKGNTPGTYRATIGVDNVSYYLGQHDSREAAMQVRLQAEQAKENDNFIQWFSEHFPDRWAKMQNKNMNKEKKHD